jgi:hypothetical protein
MHEFTKNGEHKNSEKRKFRDVPRRSEAKVVGSRSQFLERIFELTEKFEPKEKFARSYVGA